MNQSYFIGQRLLYNNEICTVINPPNRGQTHWFRRNAPAETPINSIWVFRPAVGYESCVALSNVKALPGGQL